MLKPHHLVSSRPQHILWLLEELGLDFVLYLEQPHTRPAYQRTLQRGGPVNLGGMSKRIPSRDPLSRLLRSLV